VEKQIDDIVMRANPELVGNLHLPMLARVESISDPIITESISEDFRPRYAVDLRVLDENDQPDERFPLLLAVPLPMSCAGQERGMFGFPSAGTIVELAFAYGLQSKPFIRTVLGTGLSMPRITPGETLLQAAPEVSQRADVDGNWHRETYADIYDKAMQHCVEAYTQIITTHLQHVKVTEHSTEEIGGIKVIEALGAIRLLSGGSLHMSALGDLKIVSASNQLNKTAENLTFRIGKIADSLAKEKQLIKVLDGGKVWVGSQSENVLKILSELIQVVSDIAATAKDHTHEYTDNGAPLKTKKPDQSGDFGSEKSGADGLTGRLDPIVE
jgi:hypothetical protein